VASKHVVLSYGNDHRFEYEIDSDRLVAEHLAPRPNSQFKEELLAALRAPIDYPSVDQAVIPGDRVTLALDRHTPGAAGLVAGIWEVLAPRGVEAEKFTVIHGPSFRKMFGRRSAGHCTTRRGRTPASIWLRQRPGIAFISPAMWLTRTSCSPRARSPSTH
jgi:hypothetical protein